MLKGFYIHLVGGSVMVTAIVIAAYIAVLIAKWNYYSKFTKSHK